MHSKYSSQRTIIFCDRFEYPPNVHNANHSHKNRYKYSANYRMLFDININKITEPHHKC